MRYAKTGCSLEAAAGTLEHSLAPLAPREIGLSLVQHPSIGHKKENTRGTARARREQTCRLVGKQVLWLVLQHAFGFDTTLLSCTVGDKNHLSVGFRPVDRMFRRKYSAVAPTDQLPGARRCVCRVSNVISSITLPHPRLVWVQGNTGTGALSQLGMMASGWWRYVPDRAKAPSDPRSLVRKCHGGVYAFRHPARLTAAP